MEKYLPPTGDQLTIPQREALQRIESFLNENEFNPSRIKPHLDDLVGQMSAVCESLDEQKKMADELDRYVHWNRLPGYWLTFLFQLAMKQAKSLYFVVACWLYAEAQINMNEDLSLSSLENAYNFTEQLSAISNNNSSHLVSDALRWQMRMLYAYYRRLYTTDPYSTINQLTEHLYSEKTFNELKDAFPELDRPPAELTPDDYQSVVDKCKDSEDIYLRIVARRFLGSKYEEQKNWDAAKEQYRLGLEEAKSVSLDTEIGHFYRLFGFSLRETGHLEDAAVQFKKAFFYEKEPVFSYWQALSARELGDVQFRMASRDVDLNHPSTEFELALKSYEAGRLMFESNIGMSVIPAARSIKQQLFRSYTDNALQAAMVLRDPLNILAEIEAAGPRYATELVAESNALRILPANVQLRFRRVRAVFHRNFTAYNKKYDLDQDFNNYLDSVKANRSDRLFYMNTRNELTPTITNAQLSDEIARKVLALRLPNVVFLLFHIGESLTVGTLLDVGSGQIASAIAQTGQDVWLSAHEQYHKAVQIAKSLPALDQAEKMQHAIDNLVGFYETELGQLFKTLLPFLKGKHLKIFPRLVMNEFPFHSLRVEGKYLIDYCQISYAQTLGLFLQVHQKTHPVGKLTAIYGPNVPFYIDTLPLLKSTLGNNLVDLQNPTQLQLVSSLGTENSTDILFACHGQYDPDDPTKSSLLFGSQDGMPFAEIFSELDLPEYRCVALGACESGLGRTIVTAEYIGLPVAFFASGVRYVIGGLWQVNQLTATILLSQFYQILYTGTQSVSGALNEAQRFVMGMSQEQVVNWIKTNLPNRVSSLVPIIQTKFGDPPFGHPYYWAGFYVSGDI